MERFISSLTISISRLRSSDHFHFLVHGNEGAGHWYELFESNDSSIICGNSCTKTAKFVLYTHYHDGDIDVTTSCMNDAPEHYKELLNMVTAG